jgi:RND superfamily putative drug exporter
MHATMVHPSMRLDPQPTTRRSQPWTVRVASWSARHRWPVFAGWFVVTIGLFVVSQSMGGIRALSVTGGPGAGSPTEAVLGSKAMRSGASGGAASESMTIVVASTTMPVTDPAFKTAVGDIVGRLTAVQATVGGTAGPAFASVLDPFTTPPQSGLYAPDGKAVMVTGVIPGTETERQTRTAAIAPEIAKIQADFRAYDIHAIASTLTNDQINAVISGDLDGSLRLSLPATFLILVIAFGALTASFIPLLLAVTALLAAFGALGIYSQVVSPVSPYASQLVVLIGLAVAVDYSLFMITRFRSERRAGVEKMAAIQTASATAGRAVFFSGIAVMISLSGLFLLPDEIFHSMALGTIAVIVAAIGGSLVFLPATLAIVGDGVNRGRVPIIGRAHDGHGVWASVVDRVMRRPWISAIAAAAILILLASPVRLLQLGEADLSSFPPTVDGVQAYLALQEHWPQGTLMNLSVVAEGGDAAATKTALGKLAAALPTISGLSAPVQPGTSPDGSAAWVTAVMSGSQNDPANWDIVRQVRTQVVPAFAGTGATVYVTGDAAYAMDGTQLYADGMVRILVFVLGFSFLLLMLVFHSIAIPLKAIALNLLSTGAAYGAIVLVFQKGWLGDALGVVPSEAIQNWVPIFIFTVLFGLSMDYEVFILSRIKEDVDRGASTHDAVARGIAETAGTVTSAAAIMVVVFLVFMTLRLVIIRELGMGLAVAVFLDATLIRTVLLPATMRLLGEWNWYLPPFLRWLPQIRIEGEPIGDHAAVPADEPVGFN